jgi:carbonic anhydrase
MKVYFEQYVRENIKEKTIVISCNDSYFVNSFIDNPNIILCTLFGNIIQSSSNLDLDYFKHCIIHEGAKEIIIVGHYGCEILNFLQNDKSNNPVWTEAKNYLMQLENNPFKRINLPNNYRQIIWLNTIQQVLKISKLDFLNEGNINVKIKGIIIDETRNHEVEEVNLPTT